MFGWLALAALLSAQAGAPVPPLIEPRDAVPPPHALPGPATTSTASEPAPGIEGEPLTSGDTHLVLLGGLHGFLAGMTLPGALTEFPEKSHRTTGMVLGFSLGMTAGLAATTMTKLSAGEATGLMVVDGLGSLGGLGAGLIAADSGDSTAINTAFLIGGGLALVAGSPFASSLELSGGDVSMLLLSSVLGGWHGYTISLAAAADTREVAGSVLLGTAVLGLGSVVAGSQTELEAEQVFAAASGGLWGAFLSTLALSLADDHPRGHMLIVIGATDAGLALTSILLGNGVAPRQLGYATITGLGGAFLGAALAPQLTHNGNSEPGALVGAVLGLVAGGLIAAEVGPGTAPMAAERDASGSRGGAIAFRGITPQPVIGRDGRMDGFALSVLLQNE